MVYSKSCNENESSSAWAPFHLKYWGNHGLVPSFLLWICCSKYWGGPETHPSPLVHYHLSLWPWFLWRNESGYRGQRCLSQVYFAVDADINIDVYIACSIGWTCVVGVVAVFGLLIVGIAYVLLYSNIFITFYLNPVVFFLASFYKRTICKTLQLTLGEFLSFWLVLVLQV